MSSEPKQVIPTEERARILASHSEETRDVARWKYLDRKPGSVYKQLFIKGRNIAARTLYGHYMSEEEPETPEEIAANYDLPLDVVLEAIAYCQTDPPEIREDWEAEEALMEATGMNEPGYKLHGKPRRLSPQEMNEILRG